MRWWPKRWRRATVVVCLAARSGEGGGGDGSSGDGSGGRGGCIAASHRHRPVKIFREASPSRLGGSSSGDGARETAGSIMVAMALEKAEEMVVEMADPHSAHALRSICKNAWRSLDRSVRASR